MRYIESILCMALGCATNLPSHANDLALADTQTFARQRAIKEASKPDRDQFGRAADNRLHEPAFARALGQAGKKDFAETNLQAWSEVLIKCQQATNPAWTTALMRSEPQQAHCFRY